MNATPVAHGFETNAVSQSCEFKSALCILTVCVGVEFWLARD